MSQLEMFSCVMFGVIMYFLIGIVVFDYVMKDLAHDKRLLFTALWPWALILWLTAWVLAIFDTLKSPVMRKKIKEIIISYFRFGRKDSS